MAAGASASATGAAPPPELGREPEEDADQSAEGEKKKAEDKKKRNETMEPSTESFNIQKENASSLGAPVNLLGRKSADLLRFFLSLNALVFIIVS